MWFCGMNELGSTMKGIGTDKVQELELVHGFGPNHRIQVHIHFLTMKYDYPK